MFLLALNVAILDDHTRFTCLETSTSLFAAFCTALGRRIVPIVHEDILQLEKLLTRPTRAHMTQAGREKEIQRGGGRVISPQ